MLLFTYLLAVGPAGSDTDNENESDRIVRQREGARPTADGKYPATTAAAAAVFAGLARRSSG